MLNDNDVQRPPSRAIDSIGLNRYNAKFMQIGFSKFNTPWAEFTLVLKERLFHFACQLIDRPEISILK